MEPEAAGQLLTQDSTASTTTIRLTPRSDNQLSLLALGKTEHWSSLRVLLLVGIRVNTRDDWAFFLAE